MKTFGLIILLILATVNGIMALIDILNNSVDYMTVIYHVSMFSFIILITILADENRNKIT